MSSELEVEHVADFDVDHTEEALVSTLELSLVKDLNGNDGRLLDRAKRNPVQTQTTTGQLAARSSRPWPCPRPFPCRPIHHTNTLAWTKWSSKTVGEGRRRGRENECGRAGLFSLRPTSVAIGRGDTADVGGRGLRDSLLQGESVLTCRSFRSSTG